MTDGVVSDANHNREMCGEYKYHGLGYYTELVTTKYWMVWGVDP